MKKTEAKFKFPSPIEEKVVETSFVREVISRTMTVHPRNTLWYGESRVGKTTTAKHTVTQVLESYDPYHPNAFRAAHYEAGEIASWSGNEQKKGLKSLYNAVLGRIDEGLYKCDPAETITEQLVKGLERKNIQMVFIDEAGNLSLDAIRGILMTYDYAKKIGHPLSLVFIGMDDLPSKVTKLPQVENRIHEWCYFEPYNLEDIADLLSEAHPRFSSLSLEKTEDAAVLECIHEMFGGFPGLIIPFLRKVDHYLQIEDEKLTPAFLRSINLRTTIDKKNAIDKSKDLFKKPKSPKSVR